MGVQGPEGPKGPSGPIGPAGKDAIVDYSKITSDSSLKDSIKGLILTDASFNAIVTKFINDNVSKFQGPAGKTVFGLLTSDEKAQVISSLISGSNLDILTTGLADNQALKDTITGFIKDNSTLFIPKDGIFSSSDPKFQSWLTNYSQGGTTLYCANGKCIIPNGGNNTNNTPNTLSKWSLVTDDSAVRFRQSDITDSTKLDRMRVNQDGSIFAENGLTTNGIITSTSGIYTKGGKSINNPNNWDTRFPHTDGRNYIRGDTVLDGLLKVNNIDILEEINNLKIQQLINTQDITANRSRIDALDSNSSEYVKAGQSFRMRDRQDNAYLWAKEIDWDTNRKKPEDYQSNPNHPRGLWYIEKQPI